MRRRGVTLGTTLLVALLVATLGLCLASSALGHLRLVSKSDSSTMALDLARSAMATAVGKLQSGHNVPDVRIVTGEGEGLLSFGAQADAWAIPRSLDNLQGDASVPGLNARPLPAYTSQLVAVGRCHGVERRVQALVHLPFFPYALASQGQLHSPDPLVVARLTTPGDPSSPHFPASLRSNSYITLGPGTHVVGDVIASGDINAPAGSIDGRKRPHEPPEPLLRLDLAQFDPLALGRTPNILGATIPGGAMSGLNRANNGLLVQGDLILKQALLFVHGTLEVNGDIKGSGIVVATQDLSIFGHGDLVGTSRLGMVAGGKLKVIGQDRERSIFRGTLYAEGGVDLRNLTVYGAVINNGDALARFESVNVFYEPSAIRQRVFLADANPNVIYIIHTPNGDQLSDHEQGTHWDSTVFHPTANGEFRLGMDEHVDGRAGLGGDHGDRRYSLIEAARIIAADGSSVSEVRTWLLNHSGTPSDDDAEAVLDPSQLLPLPDRFRVTLWEEP